jgi:hypothetical protein
MATDATTDTVTLTWHEAAMASHVGWMRQLAAIKAGKHDCHGYDGEGWSEHIEGACGELAVAKILGRYWDGSVNTWKADDLPGLQIRTRSRHDYDLIVRPGDDDQAAWVLVTGRCPEYRVRGWITGAEAKRASGCGTTAGGRRLTSCRLSSCVALRRSEQRLRLVDVRPRLVERTRKQRR